MAKQFRAKRKFSSKQIAILSGLTVFVAVIATSLSFAASSSTVQTGSSTSEGCIVGQVTTSSGTNTSSGSCSTQSVSSSNTTSCYNNTCTSSDGTSNGIVFTTSGSGTSGGVGGALGCAAQGADSISWRASWARAKGTIVLIDTTDTVRHALRRSTDPATGKGSWTETGLKAHKIYQAQLRQLVSGSSTLLATISCRTKSASTTPTTTKTQDSTTTTTQNGSSNSSSTGGQVTVCNNNVCTQVHGSTTSSSSSSATTTVCNNGKCTTYTTTNSSGSIGQKLVCSNGNCSYQAFEAKPVTGVKGFFTNLGRGIHNFVTSLLGGIFGR